MSNQKTLNLRISENLHDKILAYADAKNSSKSKIVKSLINKGLNSESHRQHLMDELTPHFEIMNAIKNQNAEILNCIGYMTSILAKEIKEKYSDNTLS